MANIIDDRDMYIEAGIAEYIKDHDIKITDIIDSKSCKAREIRTELISTINEQITLANQLRAKGDRMQLLKALPGYAVACILIATGDVKRLVL